MRYSTVLLLITLLAPSGSGIPAKGDRCHVYVVDVAAARKALESFKPSGNNETDARILATGTTQFPEFVTDIGEERLTTKSYPFPGSKRIITASVYYTDESMASQAPKGKVLNDSILLGVAVGDKAVEDATGAPGGAIAEATYDQYTNTIRAKQFLRVEGRDYLIGIQCDCTSDKDSQSK